MLPLLSRDSTTSSYHCLLLQGLRSTHLSLTFFRHISVLLLPLLYPLQRYPPCLRSFAFSCSLLLHRLYLVPALGYASALAGCLSCFNRFVSHFRAWEVFWNSVSAEQPHSSSVSLIAFAGVIHLGKTSSWLVHQSASSHFGILRHGREHSGISIRIQLEPVGTGGAFARMALLSVLCIADLRFLFLSFFTTSWKREHKLLGLPLLSLDFDSTGAGSHPMSFASTFTSSDSASYCLC